MLLALGLNDIPSRKFLNLRGFGSELCLAYADRVT